MPSRTPSPNAPAPLPTLPGPRASALQKLYLQALTRTLKTCSYSNFAACFPTPAARTPETLKSVWTQVVGMIESTAKQEFEGILVERDVISGLNALEGLVGSANERREGGGEQPVPPHTLPPQTLYEAHLSPMLNPIQTNLETQLQDVRKRNEGLVAAIGKQREEVEKLVRGLEAVIVDLGGVGEVLGKEERRG